MQEGHAHRESEKPGDTGKDLTGHPKSQVNGETGHKVALLDTKLRKLALTTLRGLQNTVVKNHKPKQNR